MLNNWKNNILIPKQSALNDGIYTTDTAQSLSLSFHEKMPKGAALRDLKDVSLHLAYWETPYYKKAITRFLEDIQISEDCIALDVGCGDGRFTELLIELGFQKIVATDVHLTPLQSLRDYATRKGISDKLLLIKCSADRIPIRSEVASSVLAIGVYYYLNEKFENCLREAYRILKPQGTLINSEPDLEGAVYKSLFFEEIEDALENLQTKKFKEEKGRTDFKFRLFENEEIQQLLTKHGFRVVDQHGLSLLPSILRIKMVRGEIPEEVVVKNEKEIRQLFDHFDRDGKLAKHIIWKSLK
jgi:ubiquinone/menaquinone biosynthesis C-methylase UbiE